MKSCSIYFYFYHYYYYILRNGKSIVLHQVNWPLLDKPQNSINIKGEKNKTKETGKDETNLP